MKSHLTLGWQVTANLDPSFWQTSGAKPGGQAAHDLITVPASAIANHTAIIAQSGSGKSFFLGRLVEEILLHTKARCVIVDPNSDFRRVYDVESPELWTRATYSASERSGRLPHEATREEFRAEWAKITIRVRTARTKKARNTEKFKLWWPSLSAEFLGEELDPMLRGDLYHIHTFVKALEPLLGLSRAQGKTVDLIDEAERLFRLGRQRSEDEFKNELEREFNVQQIQGALKQLKTMDTPSSFLQLSMFWPLGFVDAKTIRNRISGILKAPKYVSEGVERYYFGKAREYQAAGILEMEPQDEISPWFRLKSKRPVIRRLEVIDLPSLKDNNTRLLTVNTLIQEESDRAKAIWSTALDRPPKSDERVPTFIIVDEAHNLIPAKERNKPEAALRELFRTIVAEGRKYGLFLILVTQRPDKLDPLVVSECENKVVMKLGSISVLNKTRELLGLEDTPTRLLEKCLEFEKGRAILLGRWSPQGPQTFYCAARRTVEGGRDLRADYWAAMPQEISTKSVKKGSRRSTRRLTSSRKTYSKLKLSKKPSKKGR
jgi:hypothetical protein